MSGAKAYIGLGSNVGNGKQTLRDAWQSLDRLEGVCCMVLSSPYLSAPVDMNSDNWFTNAVGVVTTTLQPEQVLRHLLDVEAAFGRRRPDNAVGYQDRSLDLDLLYFGDMVMNSEELTLPHPQISGRLFVLEPLAELESGVLDSVTGKTPQEMIARLQTAFADGSRSRQEISRSSWEGR